MKNKILILFITCLSFTNVFGQTVNVLLDNFRPYIQKVEIKSGSAVVYEGEWSWNAATQAIEYRKSANELITKAARNTNISIKVTASEPLSELKIRYIAPTLLTQALNINYPITGIPDANKKEWEFTINASAINQDGNNDGIHYIQFTGTDLNNNSIECFSPSITSYNASEIPKHTTGNNWVPSPHAAQGYDNMHCFEIGGVGSNNILNVVINSNIAQTSVNIPVTFNAVIMGCNSSSSSKSSGDTQETKSDCSTDPEDYSYSWVFKDGVNPPQTVAGSASISKSFSSNSLITAEVTLLQNSIPVGYAIAKDIVNVGNILQADIIVDNVNALADEVFTVSASAKGGSGNYTYSWTFGNDCSRYTSSNSSVIISYSSTGYKEITLSVTSGGVTKTVKEFVVISETPQLSIDFTNGSYDNYPIIDPTRLTWFYSNVKNASGIVSYYWDFGDNSPVNYDNRLPCPTHQFPNEGTYTVTLKVTDDNSSRIVSHTYRMSQLGSLILDFSAEPNPSDQTVKFTLTTNDWGTWAYLEFGDGTHSYVPFLPDLDFPSGTLPCPGTATLTHTYSKGGTKDVILKVLYEGLWEVASEKPVVVYSNPLQPKIDISFSDWAGKPYVGAYIIDMTPFGTCQGYVSSNSPWESERGKCFYYRFGWNPVGYSGSFFQLPNEPSSYIDLNNDDIQEKFQKNLPFIFTVQLTVTGIIPNTWPIRIKTLYTTREITLYPPITTNMKTSYKVCTGSTLQLTPEVKGGKPPYSFYWYNNGTLVSMSNSLVIDRVDQNLSYTLQIGDARTGMSACREYYKSSFTVQPSPLNVDAGSPVSLCAVDAVSTIGASVTGGSGKYIYSWEPFNNLSSTTILNPNVASSTIGTNVYTLKATDEYGCTASDQVSVTVLKEIQIDLEPTYYVNGNETTLISPNILNGSGDFNYSWSNGATTKDISVNQQSGLNQTLTVTDNTYGCTKTASCKVISLSTSITTPNTFQRNKNSYTITIPITSSPGNISYAARTDCSWLTITSGASGYTGDNIILSLAENTTSADRVGKVILESYEALNSPYEIVFTQTDDDVIRVPSEFGTIQAAIDAAPDGGKVEVDEGIYHENIVFGGWSYYDNGHFHHSNKISVKATGCPENTIISALNYSSSTYVPPSCYENPTVSFIGNNSTLQGFTISGHQTRNHTNGGGIYIAFCSPELYDLIVSDNSAYGGGGIYNDHSPSKIINVKVLGNNAEFGGGIFILGDGPLLQNVLIAGNNTEFGVGCFNGVNCINGGGGGLFIAGSVTMDNVTICNNNYTNINDNFRGGVTIESGSIMLKNSIITDVIGSSGGALNINYSDINSSIRGPLAVTWGTGTINSKPMFDYNFGLLAGSPCINTGELVKLDKDGSRCDMGYTGGKGVYNSTVNVCTKGNVFTLTPKFLVIGANCSPLLSYSPGESDNYVATQQITLKNGFEAKSGSSLSFKIQPNYNEPFQYDDRCTGLKGSEKSEDTTFINDRNPVKDDFDFNAYPNPTEGSFKVMVINSKEKVCQVEILNAVGVVLKRTTINDSACDLNISEFKSGYYLIKVTSGKNFKIKVMIKN